MGKKRQRRLWSKNRHPVFYSPIVHGFDGGRQNRLNLSSVRRGRGRVEVVSERLVDLGLIQIQVRAEEIK